MSLNHFQLVPNRLITMIKLKMRNYDMVLTEKQQKYQHYRHVELISMNIIIIVIIIIN